MALYIAPALEGYAISVSVPFLAWFYLGWGVAFLIMGVLFWMRRALRWAKLAAVFYQATLWGLRFWAYRSEYAHMLWGRDLLLTILFFGVTLVLSKREARAS